MFAVLQVSGHLYPLLRGDADGRERRFSMALPSLFEKPTSRTTAD